MFPLVILRERAQNRMEADGDGPFPAELLGQNASQMRQIEVIDRHVDVPLFLKADPPGRGIKQHFVAQRNAQLAPRLLPVLRTVLHQHIVLWVAALPDGAMEMERPAVDVGQVVGIGDIHVRHVGSVLQRMGFDPLDSNIPGHIAGHTLDAQAAVPGLHVQLPFALHEIVRFRAVVGPDLRGCVFIQPAERAPGNRTHPGREFVGITLILNPHDVGIGPETMQFLHDEPLVIVIAAAAGYANNDLVPLHRENPEEVEHGHHQPRPDGAGDWADPLPYSTL